MVDWRSSLMDFRKDMDDWVFLSLKQENTSVRDHFKRQSLSVRENPKFTEDILYPHFIVIGILQILNPLFHHRLSRGNEDTKNNVSLRSSFPCFHVSFCFGNGILDCKVWDTEMTSSKFRKGGFWMREKNFQRFTLIQRGFTLNRDGRSQTETEKFSVEKKWGIVKLTKMTFSEKADRSFLKDVDLTLRMLKSRPSVATRGNRLQWVMTWSLPLFNWLRRWLMQGAEVLQRDMFDGHAIQKARPEVFERCFPTHDLKMFVVCLGF
jgi:hypothetical protein